MDNDNYYLEKYAVIVNENNVPYKCTIHNSLDKAIESIGEIFDENEGEYVIITKDNFEDYFEKERENLWRQNNWDDNPIDENVYILKIEG